MQMATWSGTNLASLNDIASLENAPVKRADGARGLQRSSRRANGGILKSIRRKLPWNRRPSTMREGGAEANHDYSEDSDSAFSTTSSVGKSSAKPKPNPRATVCPLPSPIRRFGGTSDNVGQDGLYLRRCSEGETPDERLHHGSSVPPVSAPVPVGLGNSVQPALPYPDYAFSSFPGTSPLPRTSDENSGELELYGLRSRSLTAELYKLTRYGWYWGPITRFEAEEKLHEQPDGAFLVRDSSDDRYLLSLSFRSFGKTLHCRIEHFNGVFSFYLNPSSEGFDSPVDLIEHSMSYSQSGIFCYSRARTPGAPSLPVRLTKPVSRFTQVRSLQYLCRCMIRQYTRVDHIQQLPLPKRLIEYIQERLY